MQIEIDYKNLDRDFSGGFVQNWNRLSPKILEFLKLNIKDSASKILLQSLIESETIDKGIFLKLFCIFSDISIWVFVLFSRF